MSKVTSGRMSRLKGLIKEGREVRVKDNVDELGEIAVTDKTDSALSSGGQLCCLTDLFLLCFPFTSFIFFFFYLGHRHVAGLGAGLGSLTSLLSARARVYGDPRLRSLPVDSGSDRTCLTLERFTVTWEDGGGC